MSKKALVIIALLALVGIRVPALAAQDGTFAHAWTNYSDKEKKSFMFGLATAARAFCTDIGGMQKDNSPQNIEKVFRECFNNYAGVEPAKLIAAMDALYRDTKNAMIPLDGAYKIALMQIHGDKVDDVIVQARKYGEKLKKELDQMQKPGK